MQMVRKSDFLRLTKKILRILPPELFENWTRMNTDFQDMKNKDLTEK